MSDDQPEADFHNTEAGRMKKHYVVKIVGSVRVDTTVAVVATSEEEAARTALGESIATPRRGYAIHISTRSRLSSM